MLGWGCGGGDEASSADAPAPEPAAAEQAGGDQASADSAELDSIQRANEMLLSRETFSYGGGSRDPFSSLLNLASAGPQFQDLELVGVYLDPDRPGNSVALLRERNTGRPYNLRVGDQLGRARLAQIRRTDIVFTIEDFGFERQETLALPKREEGTP
jgi:hypothetical protein